VEKLWISTGLELGINNLAGKMADKAEITVTVGVSIDLPVQPGKIAPGRKVKSAQVGRWKSLIIYYKDRLYQ
jgi:hypothetical protein